MQQTARAAVLTAPKTFEIREYPIPAIGDDEMLIKVEACGVCGTDGHEYNRDPFGLCPVVLGHEGTGEIVAMGRNITKDTAGNPVALGDKIVTCIIPCGTCDACLNTPARTNLCENVGVYGLMPADDVEAKAAVEAAILHEGPVYLRFGRLATPVFNDPETYKFELGKGVKLRDGKDIAIVATGLMVYEAIEAAKTLAAEGIEATVINIHTIKPIDEDIIVEAAKNTGLLLTVEEHSVIGGLGSAVADVLAARLPAKLVKIGVNDEFGHSGPAVDLLKEYGLCADNIVAKARDAVKAK